MYIYFANVLYLFFFLVRQCQFKGHIAEAELLDQCVLHNLVQARPVLSSSVTHSIFHLSLSLIPIMSPRPAPVLHIHSLLKGISTGVWWGDDALMKMNIQLEKGSWNDSQLVPAVLLQLPAR